MTASLHCYRFINCTSTKQISHSTTSQRCSVRLRSGDCRGHWSTILRQPVALRQCSTGTKGPECAKNISPTPLHHQPEQYKAGWVHAFKLLCQIHVFRWAFLHYKEEQNKWIVDKLNSEQHGRIKQKKTESITVKCKVVKWYQKPCVTAAIYITWHIAPNTAALKDCVSTWNLWCIYGMVHQCMVWLQLAKGDKWWVAPPLRLYCSGLLARARRLHHYRGWSHPAT